MRAAFFRAPLIACALCSLHSPARADETASFSPKQAVPYFATGPAAAARAHLQLEEFAVAADEFAAYVRSHPHAADRVQAQLLGAYASSRAGRYEAAAMAFDALRTADPLLAEYATLWSARAHLAANHADLALTRAQLIPESSLLSAEALLVVAEADTALDRRSDGIAPLQAYITRFPSSWRISEVRFDLAERLRGNKRFDEATALYRRVWLDVPQLPLAKRAEPYLRTDIQPFTADELFGRALVLFDQMRNADSERAFAGLLDAQGSERRPELSRALRPGAERVQGAGPLARGTALRRSGDGVRARP